VREAHGLQSSVDAAPAMVARARRLQSQGDGHMAELIVVGFKQDMYRASEVLNTLQDMNNSWVVDLHDAVAVYRDYNGKLRVDQSYQMTSNQGAAWGGLFGGLIGALLAAPFTGGASVAAVVAAGSLSGVALGAAAGAIDASLEGGLRDLRGLRRARRHDGSARGFRDLRAAPQPRPRPRCRPVQGLRRNHPSHDAQSTAAREGRRDPAQPIT
jgi:uncharacterized membrane protein